MTLEKKFITLQPFTVNLYDLAPGKSRLVGKADREFFDGFGNEEILEASLDVVTDLDNHGVTVDVSCSIKGSVTVPCDRCLENLEIPVEVGFEDSVVSEDGVLDLSQDIYDYVLTSLPLQKIHEDGKCNEETVKYLSK